MFKNDKQLGFISVFFVLINRKYKYTCENKVIAFNSTELCCNQTANNVVIYVCDFKV